MEKMTKLGQMIWEDGVKAGEERGESRGKAAGKAEGRAEGKISAYIEMVRDGFISTKDAAARLAITENELMDLLKQF